MPTRRRRQVDRSIAHTVGQRAPTYPHARRVGFSELLCAPHFLARHGTADPNPDRHGAPRLRLRRVRPSRQRARPAGKLRDGGPDPIPRLHCLGSRHSGMRPCGSARGLRPCSFDLALPHWPATASGEEASHEGRLLADRSGRRWLDTVHERRRAAGCGARSFVHVGQGTEPRAILGRPAPHNGLELSCPAEAGRLT